MGRDSRIGRVVPSKSIPWFERHFWCVGYDRMTLNLAVKSGALLLMKKAVLFSSSTELDNIRLSLGADIIGFYPRGIEKLENPEQSSKKQSDESIK